MPAVSVAVLAADWKMLCCACLPACATAAKLLLLGLTLILVAVEAEITPDLVHEILLLPSLPGTNAGLWNTSASSLPNPAALSISSSAGASAAGSQQEYVM